MFTKEQQKALLKLARDSITSRFTGKPIPYPQDEAFRIKTGVFVTLNEKGELRGCIGYIRGYKDLVTSVAEMAQAAAFQDPRFPPVKEHELNDIRIEISVLSDLYPVKDISEIVIGRDGLMINHPYGSGLLLPQVPVEWHWDLPTFLRQLCYKAGLGPDSWKDKQAQLYRFTAEIFSEDEENSD